MNVPIIIFSNIRQHILNLIQTLKRTVYIRYLFDIVCICVYVCQLVFDCDEPLSSDQKLIGVLVRSYFCQQ